MYLPTGQRDGTRVRPCEALTQSKFFDSADGGFIGTKQVMVVLFQPGFSVIAHAKAGCQAASRFLLLKNHDRVARLCETIGSH